MKIYVIEDNPVYNTHVCNLLEKEGFKTVAACHIDTAKKLLAKIEDDDIVLADRRLPDGDSIELLRWMRKNDMLHPFIIMTDYGDVSSAVECMKPRVERLYRKTSVKRQAAAACPFHTT